MNNATYHFSNDGLKINNDVVLQGSSFVTSNNIFFLKIQPNGLFWRFGLRFSRNPNVEFYLPDHRYKQPEFTANNIDLHLGIGEWDGYSWKDPESFHLAQYNIEGHDHLLIKRMLNTRFEEYIWKLDFAAKPGIVFSSCFASGITLFETQMPLPEQFQYFQLFAWADKIEFDLLCNIQVIKPKIETEKNVPFKVGNIIFRKGDMFDSEAIRNTNIFVLPASSLGFATPHILNRASELGIPYPVKSDPGEVKFHPVFLSEKWCLAGYAYSVGDSESSLEIIRTVASKINEFILSDPSIEENCNGINLPLLGTGTGKLQSTDVAYIYDTTLLKTAFKFLVNILNKNDFDKIKDFFLGKYVLVPEISNDEESSLAITLRDQMNLDVDNLRVYYNTDGLLEGLSFSNCSIDLKRIPQEFLGITHIYFTNCKVSNFSFLLEFKKLIGLSLSFTPMTDFSLIDKLINLEALEINHAEVGDMEFLRHLPNLKTLKLIGTKLESFQYGEYLTSIEYLNLSYNKLTDLSFLKKLEKMKKLYVSNNSIVSIDSLENCKNLEILDISGNQIKFVETIINLPNLKHLRANNIPYIETAKILLDDKDNHLTSIKNSVYRDLEVDTVEIKLPLKVVLLGNHGSGKSSLLSYILHGVIEESIASTHIIQIEQFKINEEAIPDAIFFDFGGQDYYHGIYRAFLSGGSIYLIMWNAISNLNVRQTDVNENLTQHFKVEYWLSQKKYLEEEKFGGANDPVLLIQTFADRTNREFFYDKNYRIDNYFFICLSPEAVMLNNLNNARFKLDLEYLRNSILDLITSTDARVMRPKWYSDFLSHILNVAPKDDHLPRNLTDFLPYYKRPGEKNEVEELLRDDFDQLHKQGIVLYYKDFIPDKVWLNPVKVVNYVHSTILGRDKIASNGSIVIDELSALDTNILQLLNFQKVVFYHEAGKNGPEYIIPNFLPLFQESNTNFDLLIFGLGTPRFSLKCKNFVPFGLINQLICFFGKLPEKKMFWRDRLLFTFEDMAKVLIHVDLQLLEIKVYCSYLHGVSNKQMESIERYLFFSIIGQYWDLDIPRFFDFLEYDKGSLTKDDFLNGSSQFNELLNCELLFENEACRPMDLYISKDDKHFVLYSELCNPDNELMIQSHEIDENRAFGIKSKLISTFQFQMFTKVSLKKRLKVAISYSKQDLVMVDKFRQYLTPLYDKGLIESPWFCTQLLAGQEWDEKIRKEFDEADIVFFMVSENLMSTSYVKENEIKNAIDKYDRGEPILIIPILLVPYNFTGSSPYDLTRFSALPFTLKPVSEFRNQNLAWHVISETVKITIERKLDSAKKGDPFYPALYRYFEKIVNSGKIVDFDETIEEI